MFCFGVSMFTYQGPPISNFMSKAGEYSFFYWLPTIIIGVAFFNYSQKLSMTLYNHQAKWIK